MLIVHYVLLWVSLIEGCRAMCPEELTMAKQATTITTTKQAQARDAARKSIMLSSVAAVAHSLEGAAKIRSYADAIKGARTAGLKEKETDALAKRAVVMHVAKVTSAQADAMLVHGVKRTDVVTKALDALRQCKSRAYALLETGAGSVRKARHVVKATKPDAPKSPDGKPVHVATVATVPATLKSVHVPMASKAPEVRTFLLDTLALLERSEKAMAKGLEEDTRAALTTCLAALRKLRIK